MNCVPRMRIFITQLQAEANAVCQRSHDNSRIRRIAVRVQTQSAAGTACYNKVATNQVYCSVR